MNKGTRTTFDRVSCVAMRLLSALAFCACTTQPQSTPQSERHATEERAKLAPHKAAPTKADPLQWLDPDSPFAVMWRPPVRDASSLAAIFALPARVETVLSAIQRHHHDLLRLLPESEGRADWQAIAFAPPLAQGTYTVFWVGEDAFTKLRAALDQPTFTHQVDHEWSCSLGPASYTHKICLVDRGYVAFIPRVEVGTGLSPMRMARDLPRVGGRRELDEQFSDDESLELLIWAQGPLLNWNLAQDTLQLQFELRAWGQSHTDGTPGLDGNVHLAFLDAKSAQTKLKQSGDAGLDPKLSALVQRRSIELQDEHRVHVHLQLHGRDCTVLHPSVLP